MGAIEHLTIALSAEQAQRVRARVASGSYPNESAVVAEALATLDAEDILPSTDGDEPEEIAWIKAEVTAALEEYDRDPSRGVSAEQLLAQLAADRQARARAA